jgi:HlyD family secretion protein
MIDMNVSQYLKKKSVIVICILVGVIIASFLVFGSSLKTTTAYNFVEIKKGTIESTISSTGTLKPVTEITVGTQVSGTIEKVFVDFNDKVKQGQVIAVLDSSLLRVSVNEAKSQLLKAEAQLEEVQANYNRTVTLYEKKLIAESDFLTVKTTLKTAQSTLISSQATLDRAERNLNYAIIRSPIDGTVTERSIEAGQTVAASFSTPTLFTIAKDLSKMEIKASVDESDIGQIQNGQAVRFTVQAHPGKTFEGTVKQVRVQPITTSNVVNYTVIISAENKENLLLPGMTATVEFIIEKKENVLLVPNAALRYQPSAKEISNAEERLRVSMPPPPDSLSITSYQHAPSTALAPSGQLSGSGEWKRLWYLDEYGVLSAEPVLVGISDGANTEIQVSHLSAGKKVIGSIEALTKSTTTSKSNSGGPPPPMM